jgi:tetratricopeptide (TPR) repeat protein
MIRALRTLGRDDEAQVQLEVLSRKYAGKQGALEKLDVLQDEPQSEKNKQLVAEINKKGIAAYNAKNYSAAAEAFSTALQNLPNHMGLRLNYVQALLDGLKQSFNRQVNEKAAQTLTKTGVIISPKHPQYRRYKQLQDTYDNLIKESGNTSEDRS